jgi:hypothetical protein
LPRNHTTTPGKNQRGSDNPAQVRESLKKLPALEFDVPLLCDGHSIVKDARQMVEEFLAAQP